MNDGPKPGTASNGTEIAAIVALDDHDGLEIFAANEQTDLPIDIDRWQALARAVLIDEGVVGDVEVSLMFVDEPSISALNLQFMGKEGPTDVLSFPIDEEASPRNGSPNAPHPSPLDDEEDDDDQPMMLGDVLICPVVAARNAVENARSQGSGGGTAGWGSGPFSAPRGAKAAGVYCLSLWIGLRALQSCERVRAGRR